MSIDQPNVRQALVYKKGQLAASLTQTDGVTKFEYFGEYLANKSAAPIATTLPLDGPAITLTNGATPAFFAGLLPEGPRLLAIRDRIKTSLNDELSLLLDIGADLIGDVQVLPPGADPQTTREVFEIPSKNAEFDFTKIRDEFFGSRASGLPGVQDKISSRMLNAPVKIAGIEYLLKLNPQSAPHAVENEAFFLALANKCGIETAAFDLLTDSHGQHALRLRRFDRITNFEPVAHTSSRLRLAAEDGCQTMNRYPSEKYLVDFVEMANQLAAHCPAKSVAGLNLFKQLVFAWLIGNGDAHSKNFSILEKQKGEFMVSPAYDLLCTRFYDDRTMALAIDGEKENWSRATLISAAERMLVPAKLAEKVIDAQLATLKDLPSQILDACLPFARHLNIDVSNFLKQRAKRLRAD